MEIHFLKEDALAALKANVNGNAKHYSEPTNQWIYDYFGGENPFEVLKVPVEDFQLVGSKDDIENRDAENAIILYSAMKNLSDTQATDERIWAGMAHSDLWDYMQKRWPNGKQSAVEARYFFKKSNGLKRSLFVNTLSKMWWTARLTYDPSRKDPFELTKYFSKSLHKVIPIFSSNFMSNPVIARGLLSALIELEAAGYHSEYNDWFAYATRYLNVFGGTHILDYYSSEEIKEKVLSYMWGLADTATIATEEKPTDSKTD